MTVLVSTHYMDEAERCHDIAYISYGELIARGTGRRGDRAVAAWSPSTREGPRADRLARELREQARASRWSRRSARRCMSAAPTARRWRRRSQPYRREPVQLDRGRADAGGRVHPSDGPAPGQHRGRRGMMGLSLSRIARGAGEGVHPARRDRLTFAMILGDADHAAAAVRLCDQHRSASICRPRCWSRTRATLAALGRSSALEQQRLFRHRRHGRARPAELDALIARGEVQFAITIPGDFTRRVVRGDKPQILVEADATDPAATGGAVGGARRASRRGAGARPRRARSPARGRRRPPFEVVVHRRYNPEGITAYNIVPGLLGIDPDHDPGDDDRARRHPRDASAGRWRPCWRRRCGRSR